MVPCASGIRRTCTPSRPMRAFGTGFGYGFCRNASCPWLLSRYSGADRSAATLISCGITTIPLFGFCSAELGADVAGVAFSLAALWLALSRPQLFPSWPVLAGVASGLAYGYKPLHLVGAVLVGLLILFGRAPMVQMRPSGATRVWQSAAFASGFLALAGIWLLRNQLQLGNPVYPI